MLTCQCSLRWAGTRSLYTWEHQRVRTNSSRWLWTQQTNNKYCVVLIIARWTKTCEVTREMYRACNDIMCVSKIQPEAIRWHASHALIEHFTKQVCSFASMVRWLEYITPPPSTNLFQSSSIQHPTHRHCSAAPYLWDWKMEIFTKGQTWTCLFYYTKWWSRNLHWRTLVECMSSTNWGR